MQRYTASNIIQRPNRQTSLALLVKLRTQGAHVRSHDALREPAPPTPDGTAQYRTGDTVEGFDTPISLFHVRRWAHRPGLEDEGLRTGCRPVARSALRFRVAGILEKGGGTGVKLKGGGTVGTGGKAEDGTRSTVNRRLAH